MIYCRISDDREGRQYGVKRQERDGRKLAARLGWEVVAVLYENDTSAFNPKVRREKYAILLRMLRTGEADAVIALTSRRLQRRFREAFDFLDLIEERGIAVATVKGGTYDLTTADGRRDARRKAIDDQHESEEISERVRDAKADLASQGEWGGGRRPFGYEADGITVRESEADALRWAAKRILAGTSLSAAAAKLAGDGVTTSSGKPVTAGTLRRALINPRYIGKRVYRPVTAPRKPQAHYTEAEIVGDAVWDAILDETIWRGVRALLMDPERRIHDKHGQRVWLGSGLYLCGVCGATVRSVTKAQGAPVRTAYACRLDGHVSRQADLTDDLVRSSVAELLAELPPAEDDETDVAGEMEARVTGLRARLNEQARLHAAGLIDSEQLASGSKPLRAGLEAAKEAQKDLSRQATLAAITGKADAVEAFLSGDIDYQRLTIGTLVTVTILPMAKGRPKGWRPGQPYFDAGTVEIVPRR